MYMYQLMAHAHNTRLHYADVVMVFYPQALQPDAAHLQAIATSQYQQYTQLPLQNQQLPVQQSLQHPYGAGARHETITPPGVEYPPSSMIKIEPKHDAAAHVTHAHDAVAHVTHAHDAAAHVTHAQLYNSYAAVNGLQSSQAMKYNAPPSPVGVDAGKLMPTAGDLNGSNAAAAAAAAAAVYGPGKPAAFQDWQELARAQTYAPMAAAANTSSAMPPPAHSNAPPTHAAAPYPAAYNGWDNAQYLPQQFGYGTYAYEY